MEYEYTTTDYSNLFDATTTTTTIEDPTMLAAFTAMMAGFGLFIFILSIALYVFFGIAMGKMFKKAGIPAWAAWVPFYNSWKFLEMGSFNGALILLSLIPGVGALIVSIITIISAYRIGLKFAKVANTSHFIFS